MNDIDEIKSRIDAVDFIGKRVTLKKAGRNLKGLCPFHSEKTPSFMVSPDRQAFHCFGCGKGGSVFDFVMEYEHIDFREALEELAEIAGVVLTSYQASTPQEQHLEKLKEIHHLAEEYYQFLLITHTVGENARKYIAERGVSEKTMKAFGLGYSANSWDGLSKYLKKKGYDEKLLEDSGLVIPSHRGGYDRFRGRLMFPLRDHRGETVGFAGRLLDPTIKEAKYINSPETALYKKGNMLFALDVTKKTIQKEDTAILMEGEFDVLSSFQAGIGNVVAIKGTALTEQQIRLLKRFSSKIIFALDSDLAGDAASRRGVELAEKQGLEIHVAKLPESQDPDDLARKEPLLLKKTIKQAESIYDYYVSAAILGVDLTTAYGKKKVSDDLLPIIARIENSIVQAHYVKKLSGILGVPEEAIVDTMRKIKKFGFVSPERKKVIEDLPVVPTEEKQDIYFLALLLQGNTPQLVRNMKDMFPTEAIHSITIRSITEKIRDITLSSAFVLEEFLKSTPQEWARIIDQALIWDLSELLVSEDQVLHEWEVTTRELTKRYYREQIFAITKELKNTDDEKHELISQQLADLAQKLHHLEK